MSKVTYPIVERLADEVIVTARSTVEAQQAAGEAMGGDCTIVSVERVHEGGIGGFFATELMRVTATPSRFRSVESELSAGLSSAEDLLTSMRKQSPQFVDRLITELRQTAQPVAEPATREVAAVVAEPAAVVAAGRQQPVDTAAALTPAVSEELVQRIQQAQSQPAAPTPAAAPPHALVQPQPAIQPPAQPVLHQAPPQVPARQAVPIADLPSMGVIERPDGRWSHQSLRALGLPDRIVDTALEARPSSESEWIVALMGAFSRLCAAPPVGPTVMIGPACANLARQLKLVSVGTEELAESISSVACPHITAKIARFARNDRFIHLMVGGNWHHLSGVDAHVISAATPADLLEAIRVCTAWDAVLGWCWSGSQYDRLDQFTVVSHIRSILYGAEHCTPAAERAMAFA